MSRTRFADGSGTGTNSEASAVRAVDEWIQLGNKADRLANELDMVTKPGFLQPPNLADDDSLVIALRDFAAADL